VTRTFDTPLITNDQSIDRVLNAGLPVLLVFLDGAAPPALQQAMERIAHELAGHLLVVQVPIKDNPVTRQRYQVARTPSLVAVRSGHDLTRAESVSPTDLEVHARYLLGKGPRPETTDGSASGPTGAARSASAQTGISGPVTVTDTTFNEEVMRSPLPVLVDFWAPWCGPCRMTEPVVEKLAHENPGRLKVVKINVDENPSVSMRFGVQSIPTMMVVKDGQIIDRWAGALPEGPLRSRVAPFTRA
jgi:thioredoxin 1